MHVVHQGVPVIVCACPEHNNATSEAVFDTDGKDCLIGSLDIWKSVLGSGLNIDVKYADGTAVEFEFILWILLCDILIQKSTVTVYIEVFYITVSLYEFLGVIDRTLLHWFDTITL